MSTNKPPNIFTAPPPPSGVGLYFRRALAAAQAGHHAEAESLCRLVLQSQPQHFEALHLYGLVLHLSGRQAEALRVLDRALMAQPRSAKALNNRGVVLHALGRSAEALQSHDAALAQQPAYVDAVLNRGVALKALGRLDEAIAAYEQALELDPRMADGWNNLGVILQDLRRFDAALEAYARAITLAPEYADAHWNEARCRLLLGDYALGWDEYEWRWRRASFARQHRDFTQQRWHGEDLAGRTILLHAEQGLGDSLQCLRYLPLIAARGGRVLLEVQAPLVSLLKDFHGVEAVFARGAALPAFDLHCPLLSLPHVFATRLDTIPPNVRPSAPDTQRVVAWAARLGPRRGALRVGLVWSGNPAQQDNHLRSLPLRDLLRLAAPEIECISLQKELRSDEERALVADGTIRHFGEALADFADTAALMSQVDLVISVCTSVAHLAGVMERPVWVLLQHAHDWRWLLEREDSPWYPTARLFRQERQGDWAGLIEEQLLPALRQQLAGVSHA
jgi:Tfp pilus assembly protein PilF